MYPEKSSSQVASSALTHTKTPHLLTRSATLHNFPSPFLSTSSNTALSSPISEPRAVATNPLTPATQKLQISQHSPLATLSRGKAISFADALAKLRPEMAKTDILLDDVSRRIIK